MRRFCLFDLARGGQILLNVNHIVSAIGMSGGGVSLIVAHEETAIWVSGTLDSVMEHLLAVEEEP